MGNQQGNATGVAEKKEEASHGIDMDALRAALASVVWELSSEQVVVIRGLIADELGKILPPIVEGQLVELLKAQEPAHSGPTLEQLVEGLLPRLPELIADAMPESAEAKAAREKQEAAAAVGQQQSASRRAAQEARDAQDAANEKTARSRSKAAARAHDEWQGLFGPKGGAEAVAIATLDAAVSDVHLRLDDGKSFAIDFVKTVDRADLIDVDGMIRLKSEVLLPGEIGAFAVSGVVLQLGGASAMRAEIPTPLHVGEGRSAHLPADSLVFRAFVPPSTAA